MPRHPHLASDAHDASKPASKPALPHRRLLDGLALSALAAPNLKAATLLKPLSVDPWTQNTRRADSRTPVRTAVGA
ncbi:hypothetical protein [Paraburkholderia youngii]|uniref:hypothetical protein n=1 Tax=Paraburkholderia youngii TaxID=2782701 RepID=UPI003D1A4BD8